MLLYLSKGGAVLESLIKSIERQPEMNGLSMQEFLNQFEEGQTVSITYLATIKEEKKQVAPLHISGDGVHKGHEYIVRVKKWMTQETTSSDFDFMQRWNNNIPMPFRVMRGRVLSETRGMVFMELKGTVLKTDYCMRCGRPLTHPVSRLYGLGPECGGHAHINPFNTEEELYAAFAEVKEKLGSITWKGWISKSEIEYATEVLPNGQVFTRN